MWRLKDILRFLRKFLHVILVIIFYWIWRKLRCIVDIRSYVVYQKIHPDKGESSVPYESTYLKDFEHMGCLGKGGFGIVFKSRKKVDRRLYAVKRIRLPNKQSARQKVMREVLALAELEHPCIVRYFNAWTEEPPQGWQEKTDQQLMTDISSFTRSDYSSPSSSSHKTETECTGDDEMPRKNPNLPTSSKTGSSPGMRKRALSVKQTPEEDTDTTGYETHAVVYKKNSRKGKEGERNNGMPKLRSSVYLYIQMELCHENSLNIWLANNIKNRDPQYCLWIFKQTLSAVEYIHSKGLIHRDLKPSNIFFSIDGNIKVGDFGLVTDMDDNLLSENSAAHDSNATLDTNDNVSHTAMVGTVGYMAPEQKNSRNYSEKVDIYALGLILFELLTPFSSDHEKGKEMDKAKKREINDEFMKLYPTETELVKQMLSPEAAERPTAKELSKHEVFDAIDIDPEQRIKLWKGI